MSYLELCPLFQPHEAAVLESLGAQLDIDTAGKLRHQISEINFIQRHSGGREVNLYRRNWLGQINTTKSPFINSSDEYLLGRSENPDQSLLCDIWVVRGAVFSLLFGHLSKELAATADTTFTCKLLTDPCNISSGPHYTVLHDDSELNALFETENQRGDSSAPEKLTSVYSTFLPRDYLQLAAQVGPFQYKSWRIHGLLISEALTEDDTFYVVGESLEGVKLCARNIRDSDFEYFLVLVDGNMIQAGNNFRAALESAIEFTAG